MFNNIFTANIETQALNELTSTNEARLSEAECASLRLFVMGLGNRIEEDTSLFTNTERKRLVFVQWLYAHGKLLR